MTDPPAEPPGVSRHPEHFFEAVARHLGPTYLRYSFTKGTEGECDALVEALDLRPGQLVLDVGCGPGRHSHGLALRGLRAIGVDIAEVFAGLASSAARARSSWPPPGRPSFARADARLLPVRPASMDAVVCLCQGGFGLLGGGQGEEEALAEMAASLRPGGRLALSAFSAYFATAHHEAGEEIDALSGVVHERSAVRGDRGCEATFDLWTTVFTPRELSLMCRLAGLDVREVRAVTPGRYAGQSPGLDHPEWLVLAERPASP